MTKLLLSTTALVALLALSAPAIATSDHTCQGNADCSTSTGTPTTINNDTDATATGGSATAGASSSASANGGAGGAGGAGGQGGSASATGGYTVVAPTIAPTFKVEDTNVNTAVGGAGGSVKDSGNSSNLNVNTANGGSVKDSGNSSSTSGAAVVGSGNSKTDVKTTVDTDVKNTNVVGQGQEQGQDQGQLQGQGQIQGNQNQINIGGSKQKNVTVVVNAAGLAALANSECVLSSTMSVNASVGVPGLGIGGGYAQGDTHPYDECNARAAIQVLGQLGGSIDGVPVPTIMANVAKRLTYVQAAIDEANPKPAPVAVISAPVKATATASATAATKPVRHDGK